MIFRKKHKLLIQHTFKNKNKYSVLMTTDVYKRRARQFYLTICSMIQQCHVVPPKCLYYLTLMHSENMGI